MMPFIVISHSEEGPLVEEFQTRREAETFADAVAREGMESTILTTLTEVPAVAYQPEDFGVRPSIDYPATLCPAF